MDKREYYGHPVRHDLIKSIFERNQDRFYKILSDKLKFLKHYRIRKIKTEFPVYHRMARKIKMYSLKTTVDPSGYIDLMLILDGFGEKEGLNRALCFEIKDGAFDFEKDILKYKNMENVFDNLPVIPLDSSEDPLIVLAWDEEIQNATKNKPNQIESNFHYKVRFVPLDLFFEEIQQTYKEVGEGIV
ncbi:MAG TPA: hypothetical protein PKI66_02010 [Methanobacteriaceae archaeon]|nr:hypothetical protein [Methanobacteriaceae archaeon]HNS25715.1 hypothetical protein [Methanobacteriaceae archaeon]